MPYHKGAGDRQRNGLDARSFSKTSCGCCDIPGAAFPIYANRVFIAPRWDTKRPPHRAAFGLGELRLRTANNPGRRLEKPKNSNSRKNTVCVLCSFRSLYAIIFKQSADKCIQSAVNNIVKIAAIAEAFEIVIEQISR